MNDLMMEILRLLGIIAHELVNNPLVGFIPAVLFLFFYLIKKSRLILITSLAWALYSIYEYLVQSGIACSGECNIRFDLLLFHPALLLLSILALLSFIFGKKKVKRNEFDL